VALLYFVMKRKDLAFKGLFVMFGVFIMSCGTTHLVDIWTIWHGAYRLEGGVKAVTAAVSLATAIAIWPLIPRALALPSPRQLEEANRELERRVEARTVQLRQSNERLLEFAYVASHDLKEPTRMVTSFLQLLERRSGPRLDEESREYVRFALDGARRMNDLIEALLSYSRVESGRSVVSVEAGRAFATALDNLRLQLEESRALVTSDELPAVLADSVQLVQIFQNLIENALKYRADAPPAVHVSVRLEDSQWIFSVRDEGIGIDPRYHERVFLMFQRLHPRDRYPGTGMGLAICRRIVERHGGRIWLESQPGRGTTVYFSLPVESRRDEIEDVARSA